MQVVLWSEQSGTSELLLPGPGDSVLPGLAWGKADELFTSAYWAAIARTEESLKSGARRLGDELVEEVAACLLGGHGIPAEVGLAAFYRLRESGLLAELFPTETEILEVLSGQLHVRGRSIRYRFARQKSRYLAPAIRRIRTTSPPLERGRALRDWLRGIPGIGWKTASWISRNWLDADDVAILDIHVIRAGQLAGIFPTEARLPRDYRSLEARFIEWSVALGLRPSVLDAVIWREMRSSPRLVVESLRRLGYDRGS